MKKAYLVKTKNKFQFATFNKRIAYATKTSIVNEVYCYKYSVYCTNLIYAFRNFKNTFNN